MTPPGDEDTEVAFVPDSTVSITPGDPPVAVFVAGLNVRLRFWYETEPWSFGVTETETSSLTPPVSDGAEGAFIPDSTVSVPPGDPPVARAVAGLSVVVVVSRSQVPCSFSEARLRTTWLGDAPPTSTVGLSATFVVVVWVCCPELRSQLSPMLPAGCASLVTVVLS